MLSYYRFRNSYFMLDAEKTFFQQINNLETEKLILYSQASGLINALHLAKVNDNWEVVTEEEFNTAKTEVLSMLSAN